MRQLIHLSAMAAAALAMNSLPLPTLAQILSIEDLQANLQTAVCLNNWDSAITTSSQIIVSSDITDPSREEMVRFRHQLQDLRAIAAEVEVSGCRAIAVEAADMPTQPTAQRLDWHRALASLTEGRSQSRVAATNLIAQPAADGAVDSSDCLPLVGSDRYISSGSVSSRWSYEILLSSSGYYARYWEQADPCNTLRSTLSYETQNDAYEDFRSIAD